LLIDGNVGQYHFNLFLKNNPVKQLNLWWKNYITHDASQQIPSINSRHI